MRVETREFGDFKEEFYVLELSRGGNSLVPTKTIDNIGLRPLISAAKAKKLLKSLKAEPELENIEGWKERAAAYTEGLKTGSPERYTAVLHELLYRAKSDKLSATEQRMLEQARGYFLTEVGEVLNLSGDSLEQSLVAAVES